MSNMWQPIVQGKLINLRPLEPADFEMLYGVASDPAIWQMHPERGRYKRENFTRYFQSGLESGGALAILDRNSSQIIGSSRFLGHDTNNSIVEIGYTFLSRDCWGKGHNGELKAHMLNHAFKIVESVLFFIGQENQRSRRAVEKLGATLLRTETRNPVQGDQYTAVSYKLTKQTWYE